MTITKTVLGSNTTQLALDGELNSTGFVAALDQAIVSGGWIQHDISNQYYRVYKAPNIDGATFKYAAVSIDVTRQRFWLTSWESWNAETHIGVNECYTHHGGYWQPYTFNWCDVIVYANKRWLGFQVFIRNVAAPHPVFVVETTRDHVQDTPEEGIPCWGWMTPAATSQSLPYGTSGSTTGAAVFSSPRTKSGFTGAPSAKNSYISTAFGRAGSQEYMLPSSGQPFGDGLSAVVRSSSNNAWDSNTVYTSTLRVGTRHSDLQGRLVGMKSSNISNAALMNRVAVPVDEDFMFSAEGDQVEHWTIPFNTDRPDPQSYSADSLDMPTSIINAVWNGHTIFAIDRLKKCIRYDIDSRSSTTVATFSHATFGGMIFDGTFVYMAAGDCIAKWDTTNDTVSYSEVIGAANMIRLSFDDNHIWVLDSMPVSNKGIVRKYNKSLELVSTVEITGLMSTSRGCDVACDSFGNVVAVFHDFSSYPSSQPVKVAKINASTDASSAVVSTGNAAIKDGGSNLSWLGANGMFDVTSSYNRSQPAAYQISHSICDCSQELPVRASDNSGMTIAHATTVMGASNIPGNHLPFQRYGRSIVFPSQSRLGAVDYNGVIADYTTTLSISNLDQYGLVHFGTHILASAYPAPLLLTAGGTRKMSLGGQLLLPK